MVKWQTAANRSQENARERLFFTRVFTGVGAGRQNREPAAKKRVLHHRFLSDDPIKAHTPPRLRVIAGQNKREVCVSN